MMKAVTTAIILEINGRLNDDEEQRKAEMDKMYADVEKYTTKNKEK